VPEIGDTDMGRKKRDVAWDSDDIDYGDFADDLMDDDIDLSDISGDFFSTDWEGTSRKEGRLNARRKIERRKGYRDLHTQFDDWDEYDGRDEW